MVEVIQTAELSEIALQNSVVLADGTPPVTQEKQSKRPRFVNFQYNNKVFNQPRARAPKKYRLLCSICW